MGCHPQDGGGSPARGHADAGPQTARFAPGPLRHLERLVHERVLAEAAGVSRLVTSDAPLARSLQENPAIASLRRPDGSLDMERYRLLVGSQGMTPEMFEARMRSDIATRQVEAGVTQTGFAAQVPADLALNAFYERRGGQLPRVAAAGFSARG